MMGMDMEKVWASIKRNYEDGMSISMLSEKYGVKKGTISSRVSRKKWQRKHSVNPPNESIMDTQGTGVTKKHATTKASIPVQEVADREIADTDGCSQREREFVHEYLLTHSATRAYEKVFGIYHRQRAYKFARKPQVQKLIQEYRQAMAEAFVLDAHDILREHTEIAFADIGDWLDWGTEEVDVMKDTIVDGEMRQVPAKELRSYVRFKNLDERPMNTRVIQEVKMGRDGISIKLADKGKSLDKLMEFFKSVGSDEIRELQAEKLRLEIAQMKRDNKEVGESRTVIVSNEEEMRRVLEERKKQQTIEAEFIEGENHNAEE